MISVTRLNGHRVVLNADLIKFLEETPDTMITLLNGERIIVKEPLDEVVRRAIDYTRHVRAFAV